jgi:hypothetical protein
MIEKTILDKFISSIVETITYWLEFVISGWEWSKSSNNNDVKHTLIE